MKNEGIFEIVVISGKGGTGKTSIAGSFAALSQNAVFADCDVDASDLHLILAPHQIKSEDFKSGHKARIVQDKCVSCGACLAHCRFGAIDMEGDGAGSAKFAVKTLSCEGCGVCVEFCPVKAIEFPEETCGSLYESDTRFGPMVHAALKPGAGNSGKLVSKVRERARETAERTGRNLIVTDGPPGVGCPVIASMTSANFAVLVTEPTLSGRHDLIRVAKLAEHFGISVGVCINKYDINESVAGEIERDVAKLPNARFVSRIRYDSVATRAQIEGKTIVEHSETGAAEDVRILWKKVEKEARG
jgi:MinD superfamily P-loop ATPase